MATSDFFRQVIAHTSAPPASSNVSEGDFGNQNQSPISQAILHCVQKKNHLACALPLQAHSPALYALPALMCPGMTVIICPDHAAILRNMDFFYHNGFTYPEVCYLDPAVTPHDWRDIVQQIQNNQVKLLLTTPETFDTLNFIDILVHSSISFIGIEHADYLFPPMKGYFQYSRVQDTLTRFRKKPSLVFFFTCLQENTLQQILEPLELRTPTTRIELLYHYPQVDNLQIKVHRVATRQQKHKRLIDILLQPADLTTPMTNQALLGRLFSPGAAIIRVAKLDLAEELQEYLLQYGFDSVQLWHPHLEQYQKRNLERSFTAESNQIMIAVADGHRYLRGSQGSHLKVIDWQLPNCLDELASSWLRVSSKEEHPFEQQLTTHLLFTNDELDLWKKKYLRSFSSSSSANKLVASPSNQNIQQQSAKQLYDWLNAKNCRRVDFINAWDRSAVAETLPAPCGLCDICQESPITLKRFLPSFLRF